MCCSSVSPAAVGGIRGWRGLSRRSLQHQCQHRSSHISASVIGTGAVICKVTGSLPPAAPGAICQAANSPDPILRMSVTGASSLEHRKNKLRVRGNAKSFSYVCSMAYPEIHAWAMPDAYHFHFSSRNQLDLSTYKEQPVSPLHSVMYRLDTPSLDDHSHLSRTWSLSLGTSCRRR